MQLHVIYYPNIFFKMTSEMYVKYVAEVYM